MTFKPPTSAQRTMLAKAQKLYAANLEPAVEWLAGRGISREQAATAGLGVVTGEIVDHETRVGRLAIPYMTPSGPVNMTFRCIRHANCKEVGCKKYLLHDGLQDNLYHVLTFEYAGDFICVTEGEIDALTMNICGIPALGVPGAEKWREHWTEVLDDFAYVYIMADGDKAGGKFANLVRDNIPHAVTIQMPEGEDVNSMYVKHGTLYLHERLAKRSNNA